MYTVLVGLGAALPLVWQIWRTHDEGVLTYALFTGVLALLVGRVGYVAIHWDYFIDHRDQIASLAHSGYSEHVMLLAVWGLAHIPKWPLAQQPMRYTLLTVTVAAFVGIGASVGCIAAGCAFGREVYWQDGAQTLGWLMRADWPDAFGVLNPRWPSQGLMALWLGLCWLLLLALSRRCRINDVRLMPIWLLVFAVGDSALQLLRADETLFIRNIRIEQYFDVILFILSLYRLIHSYPPNHPQT